MWWSLHIAFFQSSGEDVAARPCYRGLRRKSTTGWMFHRQVLFATGAKLPDLIVVTRMKQD